MMKSWISKKLQKGSVFKVGSLFDAWLFPFVG